MTTYTYAELQRMRRAEELALHRRFEPTSEELRAALGEGWAICRAVPNNVARYRNCVSRGRYEKAVAEIVSARLEQEQTEVEFLNDLNALLSTTLETKGADPWLALRTLAEEVRNRISDLEESR